MMETVITVLGFQKWYIEADNKRGVSLFYLSNSVETNPNKTGYMPVKKSVDDSVIEKLHHLEFPQVCKMKFDLVSRGNGMDVSIRSLEPVKNINLYK